MQSYLEYIWELFLKERESEEKILGASRDGAVPTQEGMVLNNGGLDLNVLSNKNLLRGF